MTLDQITHPALSPLHHGFFGRAGGASSGVFAGLNCGFASTDQQEVVALNRARVAERLALPPQALIGLRQVHSARVVVAADLDERDEAEADALVTDRPGLGLGVLTADCQPVLFADHGAGVIGAAHAGWRGVLAGVLEATLAAMEALGAQTRNIAAVIGPTISHGAYAVGPEFQTQFLTQDPDAIHFFATDADDGQIRFDLPGYGLARLHGAGVAQADWTGHCTYRDPARFYSCRRAAHQGDADFGRMLSAIRL